MKKLVLLISIMMLNLVAFAQDNSKYGVGSMPLVDGKVVFSEVVPVEGVTADQLYTRAKMAVVEMFKSANDVIQLDDKENGVLIVKGANSFVYKVNAFDEGTGYVKFALKIYLKDEKYKIEISGIANQLVGGTELIAERLTDKECLNSKGEVKTSGLSWGRQRMAVIDTRDQMFDTFKKKMMAEPVQNADW